MAVFWHGLCDSVQYVCEEMLGNDKSSFKLKGEKMKTSIIRLVVLTSMATLLITACGGGGSGGSSGQTVSEPNQSLNSKSYSIYNSNTGPHPKDLPTTTSLSEDVVEITCGRTDVTEDAFSNFSCLNALGEQSITFSYACDAGEIIYYDESGTVYTAGSSCLQMKCISGGRDMRDIACESDSFLVKELENDDESTAIDNEDLTHESQSDLDANLDEVDEDVE